MTAALSADSLIDLARGLGPQILQRRDEIERGRTLPLALVEAFRTAGLWRMTTPVEMGGQELDLPTFMRVIEEIARFDGSVGWTLMIGATTGMVLSFLPDDVLRGLFRSNPDLIGGGALSPSGRAVAVEGGYRVSGRWPFTSGCRHAEWFINGCIVFDGDAPRIGRTGIPVGIQVLLPAAACQIGDNWHVAGLRGTGSDDTMVFDYFVPTQHAADLFMGRSSQPGPLYRFPMMSFLAAEVAPVALGIARAAIDALVELAAAKTSTGSQNVLRQRAMVQADVARAEALLRSARAFLFETVEAAWTGVVAGRELLPEERSLIRLAAINAATSSAAAVDLMYNAGGGSSIYESSPLERCFRDVHVVSQHIVVQPATLELVGKVLLGLDPGFMPL